MRRTPSQLNVVSASVLKEAQKSLTFVLAWRHKLFHLQNGYLSNDSVWDKTFLCGARRKVLKAAADSLRAIVVSGGTLCRRIGSKEYPEIVCEGPVGHDALPPARIALSVPIVNAHDHPLVAGPVFFSHPLD